MDTCTQGKQTRLTFSDNELARQLFGERDGNLRHLADLLDIQIDARGNTVNLKGEAVAVDLSRQVLEQLYGLLKEKYPVYPADIDYALRILRENHAADLKKIFLDTVFITAKKHAITPRNQNQKAYIEAIRNYDIVFGIGPAGTGENLSGHGHGRLRADQGDRQSDHPDAARSGSRRIPGFFTWGSCGKG